MKRIPKDLKNGEPWYQARGQLYLVLYDPNTHKVVKMADDQQDRQLVRELSTQQGFERGYQVALKEAATRTFSDLSEVWTEVARATAMVNAYAKSISDMYAAQSGKVKREVKT